MALGVSDWHIDVNDPVNQSVAFPGQKRIAPEQVEYVKLFAESITLEQARVPHRDSFVVINQGTRYRIQQIVNGKYAARRISEVIPTFESLKIPMSFRKLLSSAEYNSSGGLILFCGQTGSGKTSSAVATIEDRLVRHGGFCLSVEDPPEYPIRGFHGEKGYCEQMDATDIGYEEALARSLRCFPSKTNSILFFGEIRNKASAAELLRIAIDGQLVVATIHAKDIATCVQRLLTMAGSDGEGEARYLLAASLKIVIHQSLDEHSNLRLQALEVDNTTAAIINSPHSINLVDPIRRTMDKLKSSNGIV